MTGKLKWYRRTNYKGIPATLRNSPNHKFFSKIIALAKNEHKSKDELDLLYRNINRLAVMSKKDNVAMECLFYIFMPFLKNITSEVYWKYYKTPKLSAIYSYFDIFQTAIESFIYYTTKYYDSKLSSFGYYITANLKNHLVEVALIALKKEKCVSTFEAVADSQARDHNYKDADALHKQVMSKILIEELFDFLESIPVRSEVATARDLRDEYFFGKESLTQMSKRHNISIPAVHDMIKRVKLIIIDKINEDENWDYRVSREKSKKNAQNFSILRK